MILSLLFIVINILFMTDYSHTHYIDNTICKIKVILTLTGHESSTKRVVVCTVSHHNLSNFLNFYAT